MIHAVLVPDLLAVSVTVVLAVRVPDFATEGVALVSGVPDGYGLFKALALVFLVDGFVLPVAALTVGAPSAFFYFGGGYKEAHS